MQATTIKQEAAQLANLGNAQVISAAFRRASISCENCDFPQNCAAFRSLLWSYTNTKLRLYRRNKHKSWRFSHWPTTDYRLEYDVTYLRGLLNEIWPCQECIERFNPTGKIKYPTFNAPMGKDFLA